MEDVVNVIEDWKEVGFEYILKSWSLEEFQVTLKTDVCKVSSHVLAFKSLPGPSLLVESIPVTSISITLFSAVFSSWYFDNLIGPLQSSSWIWFCAVCGTSRCCWCKVSDGWPYFSRPWIDCCVCRGEQEETNWDENKGTDKVNYQLLAFVTLIYVFSPSNFLLSSPSRHTFISWMILSC